MSRYRYADLSKVQALGYALEVISQALALQSPASAYLPKNTVSAAVQVRGDRKLRLL